MAKGCSPELLGQTALFRGLPREALEDVSKCANTHVLRSASHFFRQEEPAEQVYVLVTGKVRITQLSADGNQVFVRLIKPGEIFGVISGFGEGQYPATAQSEGAALAVSWSGKCLLELMRRYPTIAINTIKVLSQRVQEMQDRFREIATERVERRIAHVLIRLTAQAGQKQADGVLIDLKLSRQDLAEMAGTTLFTVSRTLNQWEKDSLVQISRQKVKILRPHALVQIADDLPEKPKQPTSLRLALTRRDPSGTTKT